MKKFYLLLLLFSFTGSCYLFAQSRKIITGTVKEEDGKPLNGATISVTNSSSATATNTDGSFKLSVPGNAKSLIVAFVGYQSKTIALTGADSYEVVLQKLQETLQEVVVTGAFGIKQRKKTLGYNVQEVPFSELTKGKENNFINALQGKVGNVTITPSGGAPGAGTDIVIRGLSSLNPGANNQPLIVIDGIPVNNSTNIPSVLPSGGTNGNQASSRDQFAYANRGLDINPDDIESISVLKGAGATALYGLQAANGVIIITTKKGSMGKMTINYGNSDGFDYITKYPEIQTKYREGQQGRLSFNSDGSPNRFQTFGPLRTAADPIYYNFKNAFDVGSRVENTLSAQGGSATTTYYSSVSALNQKGIVPASSYDRYTFKLSGTSKVSERVSISASANLTSAKTVAASAGDKGFMTALSYYSPTFDVNDYQNADGSMKVFSPGVIDNPVYVAHNSQMKDNLFRFVGNMGFTWTIIPRLKFDYKIGGDFYGDNLTRVVPGPRYAGDPSTLDLAGVSGGFVVEDRINFRDINSNAFLTWQDKAGSDWDYSFLIGNTIQNTYTDEVNARGEKFALPGFYDLSNTANLFNSRITNRRKYAGIFANAKIGYKNAVYVELSGRNDWSSTLPTNNNSFFYPAASLSYIFTELHHLSGKVLNFGKLRVSYAQVGKDAAPYSVGSYYSAAPGFPFGTPAGSIPGFLRSTSYGDPNLKPEMQKSFEAGTELHFLQDRLNLDFTWYTSKNVDQIIPVPIAYTSGYSSYVTNAGTIKNSGVEVELDAIPVKSKDFKWNVILNWSKNSNKVVNIKQGINEIAFYDEGRLSSKLVPGGSAGDLYGIAYKRDAKGNVMVTALGYPDNTGTTYVKAGNAFADWISNMTNSFTYKNVTLSFLLEFKKGGKMFDVTMRNSIRNGVLKITEQRYVQTVFKGVKADGTVNNIPVYLDQNFYRNTNLFNNITDVILQDASWLRLRNVTLSYQLPKQWLSGLKIIQSAGLTATASNFILWTPYKGYDPQSSAYGAGYNVYGFTGSNIPNYSSFIFSLNVKF